MKVQNMTGRTGRPVANQFILTDEDGTEYFQSYQSIIVKWEKDGKVTLDKESWHYSTTTGKYRNRYLGEYRAATERKIKDGTYTLADLNGG